MVKEKPYEPSYILNKLNYTEKEGTINNLLNILYTLTF